MYDEEKWRLSCLRFIHGIQLHEIIEKIGEDNTEENRELIKQAFKKRLNIDSLANLTGRELRIFIERVAMIMSRDFSIEVSVIGEPEGASDENKTLTEFFHLIFEYNKQKP